MYLCKIMTYELASVADNLPTCIVIFFLNYMFTVKVLWSSQSVNKGTVLKCVVYTPPQ